MCVACTYVIALSLHGHDSLKCQQLIVIANTLERLRTLTLCWMGGICEVSA